MSYYNQRGTNKKFLDFIVDGISFFRETYTKIILPLFLLSLIPLFLDTFFLPDLLFQESILSEQANQLLDDMLETGSIPSQEEYNILIQYLLISTGTLVFQLLTDNIFNVLGFCLVGFYLFKTYMNQEVDLWESMKKSFNTKLILVLLILGIGVPLGLMAFFIPGIIIYGYYFFSVYMYNAEEFDKSISNAKEISKGSILRIIGITFLSLILAALINLPYQWLIDSIWRLDQATYLSWLNPATRNYFMLLIYNIIYQLVNLLLTPLSICLLTPLFVNCVKKKGIIPVIPESSEFQTEKRASKVFHIKEGMFCPYCGERITEVSEKCPNCGKSLKFE